MKRALLATMGLLAAALVARGDYMTLEIASHEAMADYVRFESRSWAEGAEGEGGRLSANTTWAGGEHVILHDLYVPSGVTLTIGAGTVVKFHEGTRIRVEDGGSLVLAGELGNEVVLEGYEEGTGFKGISLQSSAAGYSDNGYVIANGFTFGKFATIRLNDTTAFRGAGQALVPVNVSGSRESAFSFDWVAETNGVAFANGTMGWSRVSDGTKNIVVSYPDGLEACESFTIRATTLRCCTAGKGECEVKLSEYLTTDIATHEARGEFIAFESREWAEGLEGEGGRLAANTTWEGVHKIVSDVYIPSGVTLTLAADAVVEFCTGTRIKIEDGGTLNVVGADGHDVIFRGAEGAGAFGGIVKMSNGTFADNSYVRTEGFTYGAFAGAALHDASTFRSSGLALVPVTVSGSRSTAFSIDWVAEAGGAAFAEGTLKWSGVSEGTKNISITYGSELDGFTNFTVRVAVDRACRASPATCEVKVIDFITSDIASHEAMGEFIRFETREWAEGLEGEGGRLAANATWEGVHKIVSDVYIPSGVTLTLAADAVVEFCEGTRIKIEDGGALNIAGAEGHDVIIRGADGTTNYVGVTKMSNGTYTDNMYVQYPDKPYGAYPNVSVHEATTYREAGKMYVAVTLGGSTRNQSFNIDWETDKGDRGTLAWASSSDGTKWIQIPIDAEKAGGTVRHAITITAARGCNIAMGEAVLTVLEPDYGAEGKQVGLWESETDSGGFVVNGDIQTQPIFLNDAETVQYSGRWQTYDRGEAAALLVTLETDNGKETLMRVPPSDTGAFGLDLTKYPVGLYTLKHDITDARGGTLATMQKTFSIVDDEYVELHGGTLTQNETWTADKVHVVYQTVVVPSVYTIFIEPGTVVKFMTGAGIDIAQGGAFFANGIVFTHINDDTVGGDTLSDGYTVAPPMDAYYLTGAFTFGDDTELRGITQNTALTGTISGKKTLSRGSTYRVSGTLTVASGGNLTIPAGTVLKMESGASIVVNSGGTLNAPGTRAAPIVITSIKDDSYSGDTNKDGDKTVPQPGDWEEIKNNGGTVTLANVTALYGGYGQYSNQGDAIIRTAGGETRLECCTVKHSDLRLIGRTGGTVYAENCILADGRWGIDGAVTFVNGVIADCNTGANGATLKNTILWACETYASGGSAANCVAWGETTAVQAGMAYADPLFVDPENGDFRIFEGSPCVDAADGEVAPETDFFGQPRITLTGGDSTNLVGQLPDIGICEVMPRDVTSDIDLVPRNVRTASNAVPGQMLFVKWEVANAGGSELDAAWRDTVSLVSESGREVVLGDKTTASRIASGGSAFCSGYFTVPAIPEGTWYPKVNVNSYHDIFEGALIVNNALTGEDGVEVALEALDPAVAREGVVYGGSPTVLKLRFEAGDEDRMVKFRVPAGVKVTWGFGFVPQGSSQSGGTTAADGLPVQFLVPDAEGEMDVYVVLDSDTTESYALSTESTKLTVTGVTPGTLPSSGTTTLTITGAGFGETNEVTLVGAGASIRLQPVEQDASGNLVATVDCSLLAGGTTYTMRVGSDGREAELPDAVTVAKVEGKGHFWARLVMPDSVRQGRKFTCFVEYGNDGNADIPAPIMQIAVKGDARIGILEGPVDSEVLQFVAAGSSFTAGVITPGESCQYGFIMLTGAKNAISLHSSVGQTDVPAPWSSAEGYAEAISSAATRMGRRGRDPTDYATVLELARAVENGEANSSVFGILTDGEGGPLGGGIVSLARAGDTNALAFAESDKSGFYLFEGLVPGDYCVEAGMPFDSTKTISIGQNTDMRVDMAAVRQNPMLVEVRGASGTVVLSLSSHEGVPDYVVLGVGENRYGVYGLQEDVIYALAASDGERQATAWVSPSADVPLWRIELSDVHSVSGRIESFRAAEAREGALSIRLAGSGMERFARPSDDGRFEFSDIPEGVYRLDVCETTWGFDGTGIIAVTNDLANIELLPAAASSELSGKLECPGGTSGMAIQLVAGAGCVMTADLVDSGEFTFGHVPTGPVLVSAYRGEEQVWWTQLEHQASTKTELGSIQIPSEAAGASRISATRAMAKASVDWDWFDRIFESEARMRSYELYLDALAFWGRHRPAEPPAEYRCPYNMSVYALDRWDYLEFMEKLNAFGALSLQCSRMKTTAYGFKALHDGAQLFGDFYFLYTSQTYQASKAAIAFYEFSGTYMGLGFSAAEEEIMKGFQEDVSAIDKIFAGISYGDTLASLTDSIRNLDRALSKARGRLSKNAHRLSNAAAVLTYLNLATDLVEVIRTGLNLGEAYADYRVAAEKMEIEYPKFKRAFEEYQAIVHDSWGRYHECDTKQPLWVPPLETREPVLPYAYDPNEMSGPLGAGERRLVAPGEWMTYTVYFENKSDATAAAQEVYVTEALGGALDWSTFEMVDVGFNNQLDLGLVGKRKGASETAMAGTAYKVRTELDYDAKTGVANWYMRIVDEATETRWPRDVYAGFLPPNDATGRGEGHITYRVKLRDDAAAGTEVRASASIVFDYNAAIETDPAWWNTVAEMGTATVDLGNGVETNVTVMVGAPWKGQLPEPGKRPGMRFAGWFTGPDGTGEEVTDESLVEAGAKLYAFWDASAAPELWLDVSWGSIEIGTNGVVRGYGPDGEAVEGMASRYVLTGTSSVHGVKMAGGSFTNTWTNLAIALSAKDAVAVALEGASVEVTLAGNNALSSGEDCAGVRVDAASALVLDGAGRLVARGGKCGAGIGGGKLQESGRIEVRAGTVEACGGEYGAGIGGGLVAPAAGAVVITGGSVKARGSDGGEDIGGGFGREETGVPVDADGTPVHEVEVPFATETLPAEVEVDIGGGKTYRYAGPGHEGDSSLWFWLPDGTYEFVADGDDYGVHVAGEGAAAVFTDPGNEHFENPLLGAVGVDADGAVRTGLNPAYRTSPFEVWSATGLEGAVWNWRRLPAGAYAYDATNAVIRIPGETNRMRVLRLQFLPR